MLKLTNEPAWIGISLAFQMDIFFDNYLHALQGANASWERLAYISRFCGRYAEGKSTKTRIANLLTAEATGVSVKNLRAFINSMTAHSGEIDSRLSTLHHAIKDMWVNIIEEETLYPFYNKINDDILLVRNKSGDWSKVVRALAYMTETTKTFISHNPDLLSQILNSDIVETDLDEKVYDLEDEFTEMRRLYSEDSGYGEVDDFYSAFTILQDAMKQFQEETKMNAAFFR